MTPVSLYFVALMAVFGAAFGSFLNVVIWRVPRGESVVHPRSRCPHCDAPIAWYDNIPLVSWLMLRAQCRRCSSPISPRYFIVELSTAVAFALITLLVTLQNSAPASFGALVLLVTGLCGFAACSIALAVIDAEHFRLPNPILIVMTVFAAIVVMTTARTAGLNEAAFELGEALNAIARLGDLGRRLVGAVDPDVGVPARGAGVALLLGADRAGVGLVIDRVEHRLDRRPHRLRGHAHVGDGNPSQMGS